MGWSVRLDVKLRSGMKISYLAPQFMQNYDRILPQMMEKDDQAWKYPAFLTKAVNFLIELRANQKYSIGDTRAKTVTNVPTTGKHRQVSAAVNYSFYWETRGIEAAVLGVMNPKVALVPASYGEKAQ